MVISKCIIPGKDHMDSEMSEKDRYLVEAEHWVDEHAEVLFRYAYMRVGDSNVAEDLVQETFLASLQSHKNFQRQSSVRTWLISILQHKITEFFRKSQQNAVIVSDKNPSEKDFFEKGKWKAIPARWSANPEEEASKKEFWHKFINCIRLLSPALADAFILKELKIIPSNEICDQLNISNTGLWSRLHRARLSLRRCLEKTWFSKLK